MIIFPAIDIKNGQCVRLYQGDYAQITTYAADPVEVARRWQDAGASWLHIVDLDAAAEGKPVNSDLIARIRAATSLCIEIGGGMRSLEHIKQMLETGIDRVILGTVALTKRELLREALARWHEAIAVGLDVRNGLVAISGWRETAPVKATTLANELSGEGVRRFIYTDIAHDGTLQGPNLQGLREMKDAVADAALIASGGVGSLDDVRSLAPLDIEGVIIGKALYTGAIDLATAITTCERS